MTSCRETRNSCAKKNTRPYIGFIDKSGLITDVCPAHTGIWIVRSQRPCATMQNRRGERMIRPKWRFPGKTLVRGLGGLCVLALSSVGVSLAQPASTLTDLAKDPAVKAALDAVKANEPQTIEDQIRFCQIPSPSFKEE